MASLKVEFSTVRELEKKSFRVFAYGGAGLIAGLVLTLTGLMFIGVPILVLSALVLLGGMGWVSMLGKEESRAMFCPYCSSKNDVYLSRKSFDCDICGRPVIVSESGEPVVAEAIDIEARYDR